MTTFHRQFNILRVMILPRDDDQIFQAPGDKEFAVLQEAEVPGAQKRAFPCLCQLGLKAPLRFLGSVPVPLGDARTCYPDFSHFVRRAPGQGLGVDDHDLLVSQTLATPHQRLCAILFFGRSNHAVLLQCGILHAKNDGWSGFQATGSQ